MKNIHKIAFLALMVTLLNFSGCGSSGGSDSTSKEKADVNIALLSNGATATATVNNSDANKSIDGNESTAWESISGSELNIEFKDLDKIKSITVKKSDGKGVTGGSNPDITVWLSKDGETFEMTQIGTFGISGTISCYSNSLSATQLACVLTNEYEAKYISIRTHNGESFDFSEVEVISYK